MVLTLLLLVITACGDDLPTLVPSGTADADAGTADTGIAGSGTGGADTVDGGTTEQGTTEPGTTDAGMPDVGPELPPRTPVDIRLTRKANWPGGGLEMTVVLEDEDGFAVGEDRSQDLELQWTDTEEGVAFAAQQVPPDESSGHLLIMIAPGQTAPDHDHVLAVVSDLIERRPAEERIAIYRWGQNIEQMVNFTRDREVLARVLQRVPMETAPGRARTPAEALAEATHQVSRVGNNMDRGLRWALLVGRELPGEPVDASTQVNSSVLVQWVFRDLTQTELDLMGRGRVVDWLSPGGLAAALTEVEARIEDLRGSFYEIGLCGVPLTGRQVELTLQGEDDGLSTLLAGGAPEDRSASMESSCDPQAVLRGPRPFPEVIDFAFTPEQWAVYQQRLADDSKDDFELSVGFWDDAPQGEAVAHLRGQSSLGCERRNYTLDLATNIKRHLLPSSATDEFYLLSMCLDDRYLRAHTVYQLYARFGVFPLEFRFVELRLQGQTRGIYLLMEKAKEALVDDNAGVLSVIRRSFSSGSTYPDVKYSSTQKVDAQFAYYSLLSLLAMPSGGALSVTLDDRLDSRAYLTLLAMNTLLQNGDYVDENWMISTEHLRADGTLGDWYTFMAWDPDDIFSGCHYGGTYAYVDPYELSYCAEAEIDEIILQDPVTYARYVDVLESLTSRMTEQMFAEAVDITAAGLVYYLQKPGIAPAMIELVQSNPGAVDPMVAEAEILDAANSLKDSYAARRQFILDRVADYHRLHP